MSKRSRQWVNCQYKGKAAGKTRKDAEIKHLFELIEKANNKEKR